MNFKQLKMNLKQYVSVLLLLCPANKFFQFVSAWLCVGSITCFTHFLLQKSSKQLSLISFNKTTTPIPIIASDLSFKNKAGNIYPKQFNHENKNIF
jgi:hypothetical protein